MAAWLTEMVWPPTVRVPVRAGKPGFAAMATVTDPVPVPVAAPVRVTQSRSEVAVQGHWLVVVIPTTLEPPDAGTDSDVTDSAYVQPAGTVG